MKTIHTSVCKAAISTTLLALLAACGGGGGDSAPPPVATHPSVSYTTSSGNTTAAFTTSVAAPGRFIVSSISGGSYILGSLTAATDTTQDGNGALTKLNTVTLAGNPGYAVRNIDGDAFYAQGRWTLGTVSTGASAYTLTGTDNRNFHYVALKNLAALPTSGVKTCGPARSTGATYYAGIAPYDYVTEAVTTTSNSSVSFSGAGANAVVTLNVVAGGSTANFTGAVMITSPTAAVGSLPNTNATATQITLGDAGAGKVTMAVLYSAKLPNGAVYLGMVTMLCQ